MFTNLKIEAAKWPWSTLMISERVDQATWIESSNTIPTVIMQNGIGSSHDIRYYFNDTYVDLSKDVEHLRDLSVLADRNYLA